MSKGLIATGSYRGDYGTDVSRGIYPGVVPIHKFGHNHAVGTTFENLWNPGGVYVWRSTAIIMTASSDDANDTSAGTGARTIRIEGLLDGWVEDTEDIVLNGLTPVNTTKEWFRINRVYVLTAGETDALAGNKGTLYIGTGTVTLGVPAVSYLEIDIGYNQSSHGFFSVPVGKTGYLRHWHISSDAQKATEVQFRIREQGQPFRQKGSLHLFSGTNHVPYDFPEKIPEMSDMDMLCRVDVGSASLECFWDLELRTNGT